MTTKNNVTEAVDLKVVVTRVVDAPCPVVFRAWTVPEQMAQWYSPQEVDCRSVVADVRTGGDFRIHMVSAKGDHIAIGKYLEVVPNQRLQFTWQWESYAMPDSRVTVEFEDLGDTTRLTLTHVGFPDQEDADDHKRGWTSFMEKFARWAVQNRNPAQDDYLGREFVITREFDAPRDLVFAAWTDPKHLAQWWGPRGFTNPVCDWDARPGQPIYVVMRAPNGTDYPMGGEFKDVVPPELLVFTSGALDENGKMLFEFLHTAVFVEREGKTRLMLRSRVTKTTAEAGKYIGGFEAGMTQSLVRLGELLAEKPGPLVIEKTFDAPVALVWRTMTTKEDLGRWFFDLQEFEPKVGFAFEFTVEHKGMTYSHLCKITEVVAEKKIAYTWRYKGHEGDSLVTYELFAEGKQTRLKLTHAGLETFPQTASFARTNFEGGWTSISSALKDVVEKVDREIFISRVFAAPRELVWQALTDPQQVIHWWGPRGFTTTIETMDVRPGGVWKHVMHGPDGIDYPNESVFTEVVPPERLVCAHSGGRDGAPQVHFERTWTFDVLEDGKTKVSIRMIFPTAADRDRVAREFGAIEGGRQTFERLGEHLASLTVMTGRPGGD